MPWTSVAALLAGLSLSHLVGHLTRPRGEAGLADHLLWGLPLADGHTVLNVDGSLTRAYLLGCPDHMSSTPPQLVELGRTVNRAFMPLTDRWLIHVDVMRVPGPEYPPPGAFPDPISSALDEGRRERFASAGHNFVSRHVLSVTYAPETEVYDKAWSWFVDSPGPTQTAGWRRTYERFDADTERLEQQLSRVFTVEPFATEEIASHLRACLTGRLEPVAVPESGQALRDLLVAEDLAGGFEPRIGDTHVRVVGVTGYPDTARSDAFEAFHSVAFPCRSSHRIAPLSRQVGEKVLSSHRLLWFNKHRGLRRKDTAEVFGDAHAADMAREGAEALAEIASGRTRYAAYTWCLVVHDTSAEAADEKARHLREMLGARGFPAAIETVNAVAAYLGSLPAHGGHNLRLPLLSLRNLGDLLGTTSPRLGEPYCPSTLYPPASPPVLWGVTEGTTPYRLHLVHDNVPHGLILGRTRGGKSVLVGLLALQALRFAQSQVFLFDVDYSAAFMALAAGGRHYDLRAQEGAVELQPLARVDEATERHWALSWLLEVTQLQGVSGGPEIEADLEQALELLAREPAGERRMSLLRRYARRPDVKDALRPYTRDGAHGPLFDGATDALSQGRLQVFEMTHLLRSDRTISVPVLLYLFHRIEGRLLAGRPSLILIEEAWMPLLDPQFSAQIEAWLRRLGKANAGVWLVTQGLEELLATQSSKVVLDACASRILLPDPYADEPTARELYERLGLNATERALLADAELRRQYLHSTPAGSRLFELALDDLALTVLAPRPGRTVHQMFEEARARRKRHGETWFAEYLEEQGLEEAAKRLRAHQAEAA